MSQTEITEKIPLLTSRGNIAQPGWARKMNYVFNRKQVKRNFFRLKEWDFYQLQTGDWVLQITIGHVSYAGSFTARLFNIATGESREIGKMKAFPRLKMPLNPEEPNFLQVKEKDLMISFDVKANSRRLLVKGRPSGDSPVVIDITLVNNTDNEKMVIATPFEKEGEFYLNYKENYYNCQGTALFGSRLVDFSNGRALLDWGRGLWPFTHEWFWGNGTGFIKNNPFAFNIGWGFGNTQKATENMFFYQNKAYKLGNLFVERNESDYMAPWHFKSDDGAFDVTMTPTYDNFTQTKAAFVNNSCHQVFGLFSGQAILPSGEILEISQFPAFCEHAVNRW